MNIFGLMINSGETKILQRMGWRRKRKQQQRAFLLARRISKLRRRMPICGKGWLLVDYYRRL